LIFSKLFRAKEPIAEALYFAIVAAARQPKFYAEMGVPDTVDGRFDMIVLHLYLVLDRLRPEFLEFRQALTELFFTDMDRSIREMGAGDLSVSKKIRRMAEAFGGRVTAYEEARAKGRAEMEEALTRNVYAGQAGEVSALCDWMEKAVLALASQEPDKIVAGQVVFS
jgi:cytochrome b pre-mRNA-processing protein 3